ncbi:MAG: ATP-binding protein, partial [Methanomassiliicoccales archaeon]
ATAFSSVNAGAKVKGAFHAGSQRSDIALSVKPGEAAYIPLAHNGPGAPMQLPLAEVLAKLKPWLEDASRAKLGQNIKYDRHVLANQGIEVHGYLHDTMLQGVVYQNRDGKIASINPAAMNILGKSAAELMGATSEDLEHVTLREDGTQFPSEEHPSMMALVTGKPQKNVIMGIYNPRKREYRWISIDAHPIFRPGEARPYRAYTIFTDITDLRRTQLEREREREQLQLIIDSVPAAIAIANEEGGLMHRNRLTDEIWRGSVPMVGSIEEYSKYQGFWPETGKEIAPEEWPLATALREKRPVLNQELNIVRLDDTVGTVLCSCVPMFDVNGDLTGGLAAYMDITRQKETERELSTTKILLETIIDSVPVGVRIADAGGRQIDMNRTLRRIWHEEVPVTEELMDVERQEVWWVDSDIAVQPRDWPLHEAMGTGKSAAARTFDIRRLDGSRGTILASAAPLFDDKDRLVGGMAFTQDITEIKANERELKRSNVELQHFAYLASHDLQEPLRMVVGFLSLLQKKYGEKLDPVGREYIAYAIEGGERMRALINDLLAYSRIDARREPFQGVDLNEVAEQTLELLQVSIQEHAAIISIDPLPTVPADEAQMQQVFLNLVSNSLKFRGAQAPIIHIAAKEAQHEWVVSVQDNGIGMEPEHTEKIFLMFQRLHDRAEYPGTGVGLAIAKKIVERHGGRIWVSSRPGEGATFYFSLPKVGVR